MNTASMSVQPGTLKRLLADHPYFFNWSDDRLKILASGARLVELEPGEELLKSGDVSPYSAFLLEGQLEMKPESAVARTLQAGDLDAGFPFANLRPCAYDVVAVSRAQILQIECSMLRTRPKGEARFHLPEKATGSWQAHPLVSDVAQQIRSGSLKIPPLPGIALKVRRALQRDDVELDDVATIISADPVIAGRLIQVANSAVFSGQARVDSVHGALVRLGLNRAQNIVITLATRGLYVAREPFLKTALLTSWRHAIDIASLGAVLGELTPGLEAGVGMLVGLLHEIGAIPILLAARNYPDLADTPGVLAEILEGLSPDVSQSVLESWDFGGAFTIAAAESENWLRDHDGDADYTDVLIVAHLHALVKQREFKRLPRIDETPAFQKLALGQLSPKLSLVVLDQAKAQIAELRSLLT